VASILRSYPTNVPGGFFVDDTCIDCDLCRQIQPAVFREESDHSVVYRQPVNDEEVLKASMALVACPTGSIGGGDKAGIRRAVEAFPERLDGDVYFCGYASPNTYGAASYVIRRPEGNVLVDSPRYSRSLVDRLEKMGGVSLMFLTHRDDVADHERFHTRFGCRRIIHRADAHAIPAEELLDGDEPVGLAADLLVVPVPGHTRGHAVLLYKSKYLFTGDHLAWSESRAGLTAFRSVAWYSWRAQTESMKRLLELQFEWVLPGHGRRAHLPADKMKEQLKGCIEWMARQ
jgi:glyoxylase-like metal-dependent hydrolase (beta-lactamase superfamily II)/ferredoxin